jgi:hypothetical protein
MALNALPLYQTTTSFFYTNCGFFTVTTTYVMIGSNLCQLNPIRTVEAHLVILFNITAFRPSDVLLFLPNNRSVLEVSQAESFLVSNVHFAAPPFSCN